MNLRKRYALTIALLVTSVALAISFSLAIVFTSMSESSLTQTRDVLSYKLEEQSRVRAITIARTISRHLVNPVYRFDMERIYQALRQASKEEGILYLEVFDYEGKYLHDGERSIPLFGTIPTDPVAIQAAEATGELVQVLDNALDVSVPIGSGNLAGGRLRLGMSLNSQADTLSALETVLSAQNEDRTTRGLIVAAAITFGLVIVGYFASVRFATNLSKPIRQLEASALSMAAGKYDEPLQIDRRDEIGRLASALTTLGENLVKFRLEVETRQLELKSQAQDLILAKEEAEDASRMKSQFIANMSHEIRTPMNGVMGMTQLLGRSTLNTQQRRYVDAIETSSRTMITLISEILDFSKIEVGQMQIESVEFDLFDLIDQTVVMYSDAAVEKGIGLYAYLPAGTEFIVVGDPLRISQVLNNLVSNAIKFTAEGNVQITLRPPSDKGDFELVVADSGIGMSKAQQAIVFEAFKQADGSMSRKYGGTGLGLAISKELVSLMHGSIEVQSQPRHGSTFTVGLNLPVVRKTNLPRLAEDGRPVAIVTHSDKMRDWLGAELMLLGFEVFALPAHAFDDSHAQRFRQCQIVFADAKIELPELDASTRLVMLDVSENIESSDGVFSLPFPITRTSLLALLADLSAAPVAAVGQAESASYADCSILLVEDNEINQEVARVFLEQLGCEVHTCDNGELAVAAVEARRFDLVLMDCQMPVMDGFEATRKIRQTHSEDDLPIIALTANATPADREKCLSAGMNGFVAKPFELDELAQAMSAFLDPSEGATNVSHVAQTAQDKTFSLVDENRVEMLRTVAEDKFPQLVEVYAKESSAMHEAITHTADARDLQSLLEHLHKLQRSSKNIGAQHLPQRIDEVAELLRERMRGEQSEGVGDEVQIQAIAQELILGNQQVIEYLNTRIS